jgi:hypothetical protein
MVRPFTTETQRPREHEEGRGILVPMPSWLQRSRFIGNSDRACWNRRSRDVCATNGMREALSFDLSENGFLCASVSLSGNLF